MGAIGETACLGFLGSPKKGMNHASAKTRPVVMASDYDLSNCRMPSRKYCTPEITVKTAPVHRT